MTKRLLFIDDQPELTSLVKLGLGMYDVAVDSFNDPVEAVSKFQVGRYDLVLCDVRMPKMDGFTVCRELRKRDAAVVICFLTGFPIKRAEFEALFPDLDVKAFFQKPISFAALVEFINSEMAEKPKIPEAYIEE